MALGLIDGQERVSDWAVLDQCDIDAFADLTGDHQFIHVDAVAAERAGFEGTIVHGLLTLSTLPRLLQDASDLMPASGGMSINYGFNKIRFTSPVRSGSRVRGRFKLGRHEKRKDGQHLQTIEVVIEIENEERPALIAEWLLLVTEGTSQH